MQIKIEFTEADLKKLILAEVERIHGGIPLDSPIIDILVKSKQNYKAEWENAAFRATFTHFD